MTDTPDFRELVGDAAHRRSSSGFAGCTSCRRGRAAARAVARIRATPPKIDDSKVARVQAPPPGRRLRDRPLRSPSPPSRSATPSPGQERRVQVVPSPCRCTGSAAQKAATAEIQVGSHDSGGNYPLRDERQGPEAPAEGRGWYELLLSKKGKPTLVVRRLRGRRPGDDGPPLGAVRPQTCTRKKKYDGWVVVRHVPGGTSRADRHVDLAGGAATARRGRWPRTPRA